MASRRSLYVGINLMWLPLALLSDGVATLIIPYRLTELHESSIALQIGLVTATGFAIGLVTQPVAGLVSDALRSRLGRRGFITIGMLLVLPGLFALGTASSVGALVVSFAAIQVAANIVQAGLQAFIPDLVAPGRRGLASGTKGLFDIGGAVVGFGLLGYLLSRGGVPLAAAITAIVVIGIGIATLALVREPAIPASAPLRGLRYSFTLDIRRHHRFASAVAARFLFLLGTFGIGRLLYVFIQQELGLSDSAAPEAVGSILAAFALVTGCIALAGGWLADRSGRLAPMAGGAALGAAGALVLVTGGAPGIASGGLLMSAGSGLFAAGNWAVTSDLVPREEAARFMGIANFGTVGAAAAAGGAGLLVAFGDRLASGLGYPLLFVTASTAMALSLPFSVRACRSAPTTHTMLWPLRRA